ncbi:EKC/KEOPS complex subunit TPRKB-like [Chelonus insularis]|uniref:EKC/KEOPS complex subunit TPRKB-like n=1 Tax=Chelonus insularis TaxID=460826 RepID=UPI0015898985|nr:EKC/KEOPS complex subunit TPRKB-like [Chelonus insularis]
MEKVFEQQLDQDTGKSLSLYFYTNVSNMPEFRKKVLSGELKCCILKVSLIIDVFQVVVAANKAVKREKLGILVTKSVFTEMIYLMSLSDSISASLNRFGAQDDDENVVIVVIHEKENKEYPEEIVSHINGQLTSFLDIRKCCNEKLIKEIYKIGRNELETSSLVDAVISRIGGSYPIKMR